MLFIQEIALEYTKAVRNSNAANVRRSVRFLPVEFDKSKITDEILFNKAELFQAPDGMRGPYSKTKIYGENALFTGNFTNFFGYRVFVKKAENGYEVLYIDRSHRGYAKSKFTLTNGKSGRIVYNERHGSIFDCAEWYYEIVTFNFVCADKSAFKPKIFFVKEPDFTFTDMKPLRYNGF